jgi:phosphatidylserine synthase
MTKKHLLFEFSKADYVTCLAIVLIVNSFWLLWHGQIKLAISIGFLSMFFDYTDGAVARKFGASQYGKVLDSLYDMLGWVLFPALVVNIEAKWALWSMVITTAYCLFAAIRLSRFTVVGYIKANKNYYIGLPVLFSKYALLVVLIAGAKISALILAIMVPLMVSSRPFKKPAPFLAQLEIVYALMFLWLYIKNA